MNRVLSRSGSVSRAVIAAAFAWFTASGGAIAQESPAPTAAAPSAAPAEAATQSRRDRRRAPKPEPAAAPESTATATAAAPAAIVEPEKICKNFKPLGSHMAKRVCGTPEQWAAFEKKTTDAGEDDLRNVRSTGGVIATTPGTGAAP